MALIFSLILTIIGILVLFYKKGEYLIQYLYIWILFSPVLYSIITYLSITDYWIIITWNNRLVLLVFLIIIFSKKKHINQIKKTFFIYIFFCLYYIFTSLLRGVGFIESIQYSYGCYLSLVCLPIIFTLKTDCNKLIKFLDVILWSEIIIGLIQVKFPSLNYNSVIETCSDGFSPLCGTMHGNNTYSEYILCLWYAMTYIHLRLKSFNIYNVIQSIFVLYLLIQSGIRIVLVAAFPLYTYLFVRFYLKNNGKTNKLRLLYTCITISLCLFLIIKTFAGIGVTYTNNATSNIERTAVIASVFLDNSYLLTHTTFALTYDVLKYLPINYIFGPGLLYINSGYDGYINFLAGNVTDATLAIYICETGIIGLIFLIFFIRNIYKNYCESNKSILFLIISLLLLSITDSGFFTGVNLLTLFTMIYILKNKKILKDD